MSTIRKCNNCYYQLIDGCKLKTNKEYLTVKDHCQCHSFSNGKNEKIVKTERT